jgi:NADH-quinone oxidoreductase subunit K
MELFTGVSVNHYIFLATVLFAIGAFGVMYRRNAIIIFMCIELMLNAVNLLLVTFSRQWGVNGTDAQVFVFFIMAVAAAEVAVGLAILMMIYKNTSTTDIDMLNKLKG